MLDVEGGVEISMCAEATDQTAKRMLVGPNGSVYIVAHAAFLGGVGALDSGCSYAPFGGIPGKLLGDMREVGSPQVGIHSSGLVLHRGHRQLFIGKLTPFMLSKALIDRPVDLLLHVPDQALPTFAAGGGKLGDALLFQACALLRLAPPLLPIPLMPLAQFAIEHPVVLAIAGREEVGKTHIHPDHRSIRVGVNRHDLIVGQGQPPDAILTFIERHAGVELPHLSCLWVSELLFVVRRQLDGDQQGLAKLQGADLEPVVEGGVV